MKLSFLSVHSYSSVDFKQFALLTPSFCWLISHHMGNSNIFALTSLFFCCLILSFKFSFLPIICRILPSPPFFVKMIMKNSCDINNLQLHRNQQRLRVFVYADILCEQKLYGTFSFYLPLHDDQLLKIKKLVK